MPAQRGLACVGSNDGAGERQLICLTRPAASLALGECIIEFYYLIIKLQ